MIRIFYLISTILLCYYLKFLELYVATNLYLPLPSIISAFQSDEITNSDFAVLSNSTDLIYLKTSQILSARNYPRILLILITTLFIDKVPVWLPITLSSVSLFANQIFYYFATNYKRLFAARILESVAASMITPINNKILSQLFEGKSQTNNKLSKWNQISVGGMNIIGFIADLISPVIGQFVYMKYGRTALYLITIGMSSFLLVLVPVWCYFLKRSPSISKDETKPLLSKLKQEKNSNKKRITLKVLYRNYAFLLYSFWNIFNSANYIFGRSSPTEIWLKDYFGISNAQVYRFWMISNFSAIPIYIVMYAVSYRFMRCAYTIMMVNSVIYTLSWLAIPFIPSADYIVACNLCGAVSNFMILLADQSIFNELVKLHISKEYLGRLGTFIAMAYTVSNITASNLAGFLPEFYGFNVYCYINAAISAIMILFNSGYYRYFKETQLI